MIRPLLDDADIDRDDQELLALIRGGNRDALDRLIRRHQRWIYNIVVRMLYWPHDAEDVTQEILVKVITKLSSFEGRSSFRTWLYRIAVNHVLNTERDRSAEWNFVRYAEGLDGAPDAELPDPSPGADAMLIEEESKITCTSGMLLCLDRRQRLAFILGEILGVTDVVGAELLDVSRDNFRQLLARARRDLYAFMNDKCGLVNTANPCRCAKKTQAFIDAGYVDPKRLVFVQIHSKRMKELAGPIHDDLGRLDVAYGEIYRNHAFYDAPDFVESLRALISDPQFRTILEGT
jgi:RNA polymerase sigma factor (sigma-70 family)